MLIYVHFSNLLRYQDDTYSYIISTDRESVAAFLEAVHAHYYCCCAIQLQLQARMAVKNIILDTADDISAGLTLFRCEWCCNGDRESSIRMSHFVILVETERCDYKGYFGKHPAIQNYEAGSTFYLVNCLGSTAALRPPKSAIIHLSLTTAC